MPVWEYYNPNPVGNVVGDCAVRAISKALNISWEEAHIKMMIMALNMGDMANSNVVWGAVLRQAGFYRAIIPNTCPDCYTAEDFCYDHPYGTYVLGFGDHAATVVNGKLYDSWDSSKLIPIYYWFKFKKEDNNGSI